MCEICNKVKGMDVANALREISGAMQDATFIKQLDHLSALLDKVLDIKDVASNPEADEDWERSHR